MTLIELMVSLAIVSVLITTATALVTTLSQLKRDGERVVEVRGNSSTAMSLIQFDALNAGYRFASPPFVTRIIPNVSGSEAELSAFSTAISATAGCGPGGVAAGTDVIEFREGIASGEPAPISSGSCTGATCTATISGVTRPGIDPATNDIVLMSDGQTANVCMGKVTLVAGPTYTVQLLAQDFSNASATTYVGCMATVNGGATGRLMRLGRRVRYMICAPPSTQPDLRPGLYQQVSVNNGVLSAPALVQEGVEDLQASWFVGDPLGEITAGGVCAGSGAGRVCQCDSIAGSPCSPFVSAPTATGTLDSAAAAAFTSRGAYQIRGIGIGLTSISTRSRSPRSWAAGTTNTNRTALDQFVRPALFDHAVGTTMSGDFRSTVSTSVVLQNAVMVKP
jgi:Tfp pilus assembly protein PilW